MEQRSLVPVTLAYLRRTPAIPVLLVVVVAGAAAFGSTFLSARNFASMAVASSFLLIISVGMTFVIISGGIDLSVGSMLALGAVLAAYSARWGSGPAILIPLAVCTAIGLIQGLLIGKGRMPPFIVTLAGLAVCPRACLQGVRQRQHHPFDPGGGMGDQAGPIDLSSAWGFLPGSPWSCSCWGWSCCTDTRLGYSTYAIGGSEEAALLMGVRVVRVKLVLYTLTGFLGGVAGLLVAARSSSGLSTIGAGLELKAIAAVVIGGTLLTGGAGGLTGTLAGVFLLGVIENLINQIGTLSYYHQLVASGVFLIIVVSAQSLFAKRELRRAGRVT